MADGSFGFAPPVPLDQVAMPQLAIPAPNFDPAAAPPPAQVAVQPAAPTADPSQPYKPSIWDVLQGVLWDKKSPAAAAMDARQRNYQSQTQAMMIDTLKNAPADQRAAMLLNPQKLGEAMASRFQSMALKGGETRDNGEGGPASTIAPLLGFDDKSGRGYSVGAGGVTSTGGTQLPGDFSISPTGAVNSGRTGPTGQSITLPQIVAAGSGAGTFTPSLVGPGDAAPPAAGGPATDAATAPSASAPRGIKNNNFGNVKALPPGHMWPGQTGVDPQGFAVFGTPQDGLRAAQMNLQAYAKQGINTPAAIAAKWAPAGDGNNDPVAYGAYLAGKLGVHPNDPIDMSDPKVQQTLLRGIVDNENGPSAIATWRTPKGATATSAAAPAPGWSGGQPLRPRTLSPAESAGLGYAPGTVVEQDAAGHNTVSQNPQYDAAWDRGQRDSFTGWEPVKQWQSVAKPTYQAMVSNIGQMSGPAAYATLDNAIRTDNPGMGTRQQQLEAFEHKFGPVANLMGTLLNYQGKGSIPLDIQQKIMDAAVPFAQAHWDAANSLYEAQRKTAQDHGRNPDDSVTPIGPRPLAVTVTPKGSIFHVTSPGDAQALPGGSVFQTPDGRLKRVP